MRMPPLDEAFWVRMSAGGAADRADASVAATADADEPLAILGGKPVRKGRFTSWPMITESDERPGWKSCARGGGTGSTAITPIGLKRPGPGRSAPSIAWPSPMARVRSITSLAALGIGPGDEVIVPPYTFVATINAVLMHHALPVFVDTDPETFQIDARKIEAAITERTACIMPVHLGGSAADMDTILAVAAKHKLPVVEDACQAHLAEWRTKKVSTLGDLGCFSFQASKNLNSGEGGAILTNSDDAVRAMQELSEQRPDGGQRRRSATSATGPTCGSPSSRPRSYCSSSPGSRSNPAAASKTRPISPSSRARSPASRPPGCTTAAPAMLPSSTCSAMIPRVSSGCRGRGSSRPCTPREFPSPAATSRSTGSRS